MANTVYSRLQSEDDNQYVVLKYFISIAIQYITTIYIGTTAPLADKKCRFFFDLPSSVNLVSGLPIQILRLVTVSSNFVVILLSKKDGDIRQRRNQT